MTSLRSWIYKDQVILIRMRQSRQTPIFTDFLDLKNKMQHLLIHKGYGNQSHMYYKPPPPQDKGEILIQFSAAYFEP